MKIIISFEAFLSIFEHANEFPSNEIGGFLFGFLKNQILFIKQAYSGKESGSSVHIELSSIEMIQAIEYMNARYYNLKLIGWYHSHPGMGAHFFSQTDVNTQKKYQIFFPEAKALVIDPKKKVTKIPFISCDLQAWNVKNNKPEKMKLLFGKSFKNKKENFDNHMKILGRRYIDLKKIELFMQENINANIKLNLTRSKYHVNFQENNRNIWMKIYTKKYDDFGFFDVLLFGKFKNENFENLIEFLNRSKIIATFVNKKRKFQKYLLLKDVSRVKTTEFLNILKKILSFSFRK